MNYYINCLTDSTTLQREVKELIPDMNLRRRMSTLVKMAVCTGVETLLDFEAQGTVDAVVTATGLGCIADSEKFLINLIDSKEQMLNPTPFIQSTFNTVGAQIALIRSLHGPNTTFTHRYTGFESAVIDATLRLSSGKADAVLVGVFDEATPTLEKLMQRMRLLKDKQLGEGAYFFVLTKRRLLTSVAVIEEISFCPTRIEELLLSSASNSDARFSLSTNDTFWCGAMAQTIARVISTPCNGCIINDLGGRFNSFIRVRCL